MDTSDSTPQTPLVQCSRKEQCVNPQGALLPATLEFFSRDGQLKSGLRTTCKACDSARHRRFREEHPDVTREREQKDYVKHKSKRKAKMSEYRESHREDLRDYQRWYREAYPERSAESLKKSHEKNRDKNREKARQKRSDFPELIRAKDRNWYIHNRDYYTVGKGRATRLRRRARVKNLPANFSVQDLNTCLDYWYNCCSYCGCQQGFFNPITIDHFIPLADISCTGTVPLNLVLACRTCNSSKQDFVPEQWVTKRFGKKRGTAILRRIEEYFVWLKQQDPKSPL